MAVPGVGRKASTGSISIPNVTESFFSISAAAAKARRTRSFAKIPRGISSPMWSGFGSISRIQRWLVFGGSWGSTLSIAYAETHPDRVTHLVLRGIFLLRQWEIDWLYQRGADAIFPDKWEDYVKPIPPEEHGDILTAYHKRLISTDRAVQREAAIAWSSWEGSTSKLYIDPDMVAHYTEGDFAIAFARIENHYFVNHGFMEEGQLLRDIDRIRHIPTVIVQGRYDIVCPMRSAWDLHRAFPEAELVISPTSGHSAFEPENRSSLIEWTDRFRVWP